MPPYTYEYPRPCVTVDILLVSGSPGDYSLLLIQRKNPPFKDCWALPGGFVDIDEDLETAACRELTEETGLFFPALRQFRAYGTVNRDPRHRTISIVFYTFTKRKKTNPVAGDDASNVQWFPLTGLPGLAFDHSNIIQDFFAFLNFEKQQTKPL